MQHMSVAAFALAIPALFAASISGAAAEDRTIALYNIHTKDTISIVYKRDGQFVPDAVKKLNHFMRDWRSNAATDMDPKLFDLIWEIHTELGSKKPVHLISGHRSEKTNNKLRKTRGGQAKRSKHITGQAADIHFPDVPIKQLRNSALVRERGGVGYYPTSAIPFVHVDTGGVRHWPRLPRQELAVLFPSGKSQHVPTDGKPITKKDFQVALASLQKKGGELPIAVRNKLQGGSEGRTILASLTPEPSAPLPEPKPQMTFASLTPFAGLGGRSRKAEELQPAGRPEIQQTAAKIEGDEFQRDFVSKAPSDTVPDDQIAASPDYDDDHPDELNYQPFPVLPLMSDTPVANMDLSDGAAELELPKVHVMFSEQRDMLNTQFQSGLQYAHMFWAQRFRGSAVNTAQQRLDRDGSDEPIRTAQAPRTPK
jgi:uncharacterized protein YcbK (DUF882 family)